jgi:transposase
MGVAGSADQILEHRPGTREAGGDVAVAGVARVTWAELPDNVPRTGQGPRLEALVGHLTGTYRLSRRDTKQGAPSGPWDVWRIPLAVGTISRIERRLAEALEPVSEAIGRCLAAATQIHVDETVWKEKGKVLWLRVPAKRVARPPGTP